MPHCHEDVPEVPAAPPPEPEAPRRLSERWQFLLSFLAVTAILVLASAVAYARSTTPPAVELAPGATIYYNEACSDCHTYLMDELMPTLEAAGASPVVKDYINTPAYRGELRALNDALGIPFELQSHLVTFVRDARISVFEGHVPAALIVEALAAPERTSRLLIHQDEMDGAVVYGAWAFDGEVRHYALGTPLSEYLTWFAANGGGGTERPPPAILPLVLTSGFVDGLNPCAFAVLLFFITFLFVARRPRAEVARIGMLYIYAVFLAYLLIGLGLMGAIMLTEDPHFLARVSGVLVAGIGVYVLVQPRVPALPDLFHMPKGTWDKVRVWMLRGTSPAAAASGFLVGLCTFPCSGGIYVAVLGLLAAKTSYVEGLGYLYLYNVAFVLPLVIVLAVVSNKALARRVTTWERGHTSKIRTVGALATIAVGVLTVLLV